jgi:carbamate kinase
MHNSIMSRSRKIVVALGGNAISGFGDKGDIPSQFASARGTAAVLADLIEAGHRLLITHGNGPQVGNILRRVELSSHEVYPIDLGLCVADSQAGMGYMICQCLQNELLQRGRNERPATIVTTVLFDRSDPHCTHPTKPIGIYYNAGQAEQHRIRDGWVMHDIPGRGFRRVVPSPAPKEIMELPIIRRLFNAGEVLVAAGGGGIPVVYTEGWGYEGLEAVIDKDLTAALLAVGVEADTLAILTDEECVWLRYGRPDAERLTRVTAADARRWLEAGEFPEGSMGPKVQAAINFLRDSPRSDPTAIITHAAKLTEALAGKTGTTFVRE